MSTSANSAEIVNGENAPTGEKPVWGADGIAPLINRTRRQTAHLLATGALKSAKKIGGRYCAYPSALRREFGGG